MTDLALAESYLRKAERALVEAHVLLRETSSEGACSRAYYAMHDAAHAALLADGHETEATVAKTHHGLITEFGKKIVLGGKLDSCFGRDLNRVQNIRLAADYSCEPPPLDDAKSVVEKAERFVAAVRNLVRR